MRAAATTEERVPFLDLLRALAILLVILHHVCLNLPQIPALSWIADRGFAGVDIFFVLSGWLIGGQLFRRLGDAPRLQLRWVWTFWLRRWLRTLPPYYAALLLMILFPLPNVISGRDALGMVPFLQNYLDPAKWVISWSLCIEEHFYLLLPVVVAVGCLLPRGLRLAGALLLLLLSPAWRWVAYAAMPEHDLLHVLSQLYFPTHARLDGLAMGVILAGVRQWLPAVWQRLVRHGALLAGLGTVVLLVHWAPWLDTGPLPFSYRLSFHYAVLDSAVTGLGVALMIPFGATAAKRLRAPGAFHVSEHAYALYLTHTAILQLFLPLRSWWAVAGALLAIWLAAVLLRLLVEVPSLRLRSALLRRMAASRAAA